MPTGDVVVVDASALVDLLGRRAGAPVRQRLRGTAIHAPAHVDAEVLSAFGRWHRGAEVAAEEVEERLRTFSAMPLIRHPLSGLLVGAWTRRQNIRLADGLYVELAAQLAVPLITTDRRLARATSLAEVVG